MPLDPLEEQLRAWRYCYLGPPAPVRSSSEEDRTGPGSHPIARQAEFAPKTKARADRALAGRDGRSRRRMMAQRSGVQNMHMVPQHFVDPIRCKESRHAGPRSGGFDDSMDPAVRLLDRAAMDLYRFDTVKGLVFRFEYLTVGTQRDKADQIASIIGAPMTVRMYRMHLEQARYWISGRVAA